VQLLLDGATLDAFAPLSAAARVQVVLPGLLPRLLVLLAAALLEVCAWDGHGFVCV
jgi:hypothetical protein